MDVLRTAVSALAAFDADSTDNSPAATMRKGIRLTSQVPMVIAAHEHIRNGRAPVAAGSRARPRGEFPVDAARARRRAPTPRD